ncbi:MAG: hypothetical protein WA906_06860, partial [Pacificimonas sp.]
ATLEIDDADCTANALVLVVDEPERLIERMRDWKPRLFDVRADREIGAAIKRGDTVIGWSRGAVGDRRGQEILPGAGVPGDSSGLSFGLPGAEAPVTSTGFPSRVSIGFSYRRDVSVVIFDVRRLEGVHLNQLADYATIYLIGSPRRLLEHEKLAGLSILTLFEDGPLAAPIGLTRLDRAYLRGLYSLRPNENSRRLAASTRVAYEQIAGDSCGSVDKPCENDAS